MKVPSTAKPVPSCRHMDVLRAILCDAYLNTHVLLPYRDKNLGLWWSCIWAPRVLRSGWEPVSWDRCSDHGEEGSPAEGGTARDGEAREALDFLDLHLFARVSVGRRGLSLWAEAHRKGRPVSIDGEEEQLVLREPVEVPIALDKWKWFMLSSRVFQGYLC